MAMLAEPRRRKNNYVLTPRGKPLYEDDSRYGSKMLQKMGWSKGKGLGARESGETDFVRVNFKSDVGGLGFEKRDDQWTQHEQGFNGLLQSLNTQNGETQGTNNEADDDAAEGIQTVGFGFKSEKKKDKKVKDALSGESLEEKSKKSKARVHYKKFTRGKDLSQYSEKDLANIFGKKALDIDESGVKNDEKNKQVLEEKSISITDYFKQKMEKRKKSDKNSNSDLIPGIANVQIEESASTISDYFKRKMEDRKSKTKELNDCMKEETPGNSNPFAETHYEEPAPKKHKKDKKSTKVIDEEVLSETYFPVVKSEKRKKKRKNQVEIPQENSNDCNLQTTEDVCRLPRQTEEDTATEVPQKKSKTTKISSRESEMNEVANTVTEAAQTNSKSTKINDIPDNIVSNTKKVSNLDVSVKLIENRSPNTEDTKKSEQPSDLENILENINVYTISTYTAEKFRRTKIDGFKGANLVNFNGYPFDKDMKLDIIRCLNDEKRILKFWEGSLDKYQGSEQTNEHVSSVISKTKAKKRAFKKSAHKRKSAFKMGI